MNTTVPRRTWNTARLAVRACALGITAVLSVPMASWAQEGIVNLSPRYSQALRGLATAVEPPPPVATPASPSPLGTATRDSSVKRSQYDPAGLSRRGLGPATPGRTGIVADPPISYGGPPPWQVDDITSRDGPQIPEPMVFDLVRGLGARRGEFEINVLNLVPFRRRETTYEWAPEIEYALWDGFAVEFELPIFNTTIEATKYAAQYTFGTAFDDAFIHGIQGILFHNILDSELAVTVLYLAGLRLDERWSLFTMMGINFGPQVFPFDDLLPRRGTDILFNPTVFYDVNERLVLGVETNFLRRIEGSGDLLIIPQFHYHFNEHWTLQFGMGFRDNFREQFPELGFRVIWER